jgi:hypothetical protein
MHKNKFICSVGIGFALGKSLTLGIRSDSTLKAIFFGVSLTPHLFDSDPSHLGVAL